MAKQRTKKDNTARENMEVGLTSSVTSIELNKITPNKKNHRKYYDQEALAELSESIKESGLIQPIVVRPIDNNGEFQYEIIAGERRFRATQQAQLNTIDAIIKNVSEYEGQILALSENLLRSNPSPMELANGYVEAIAARQAEQEEDKDASISALAKDLGLSRSKVSNTLRLLSLDSDIQDKIATGEVSATVGRTLAASDQNTQVKVLETIKEKGEALTVKNVEKELIKISPERAKKEKDKKAKSKAKKEAEDKLKEAALRAKIEKEIAFSSSAEMEEEAVITEDVDMEPIEKPSVEDMVIGNIELTKVKADVNIKRLQSLLGTEIKLGDGGILISTVGIINAFETSELLIRALKLYNDNAK